MNVKYYKELSHELNRNTEFEVYGHTGIPYLVFPAQNGRLYDFENFGMIDATHEYVDVGRIQFFCCDSIDNETQGNIDGSPREHIEQRECCYYYIIDELILRIQEISTYASSGEEPHDMVACGCSLGAFHALNFFLREPDLPNRVLAMSGLYHADCFFHDYHDELTYRNSSGDYLPNMPQDHPYMGLYRNSEIALYCGQRTRKWETESSIHQMEAIFADKHINVWIDFWGYDVSHDWYRWKRQIDYFLRFMVQGPIYQIFFFGGLSQMESLMCLHSDTAYVYGLSVSLVVAEHPCEYLYIRCMLNILIDDYLSILYYIFI